MAERYYWLKLHDDFFDSLRIKKLRKMAGGDTYTIIYLKMQLIAMNKDGIISFKGYEDDICDELALELNEDPENVKVTLAYLLSCGLCETSDSISYYFPYAIENTGSEGKDAARMRIARNKAKALVKPEATDFDEQCANNVRTLSEQCSIEKDKEIDKDIKERNIKKERFSPPTAEEVDAYCKERNNGIDGQTFVDFYASKGWLVGKTPMRDWRAAVRTWEAHRKADKPKKTTTDYSVVGDLSWQIIHNKVLGDDNENREKDKKPAKPQTPKPQVKPASKTNVAFANASWKRLRAEMGLDDADEDNN